jgi:hypothetical protein
MIHDLLRVVPKSHGARDRVTPTDVLTSQLRVAPETPPLLQLSYTDPYSPYSL